VPLDALFGKSSIPRPLTIKSPALGIPKADTESASPSGYHCLLDFRAFVASPCSPGETCELFFSLFSKAHGKFLTEEYCLVLNHNGSPARDAERRLGKLRTLFADLRADDVQPGTYLVCRIVRNGYMKMAAEASSVVSPESPRRTTMAAKRSSGIFADGTKWRSSLSISDNVTDDSGSMVSGYEPKRAPTIDTVMSSGTLLGGRSSVRRPLGCAVFELPTLSRLTGDAADDLVMPIYVAKDEASFATLHADIILFNERMYEQSPRAQAIAFGLRLFHGPIEQVIREHPSLLLETPQTLRLGFPDVVPPGLVRNDLYIKLWDASFSTLFPAGGTLRVRKTVAPIPASTQVSLEVRRADGTLVPDSLYAGGSGEPPSAQYHSIVYYHNDRPTFGELIKIALPQGSGDCHLFLSFRHKSRDREDRANYDGDRPFAFAYLPLFSHNASIKDGKHELILYHMEKPAIQPTPNLYFEVPSTGEPKLSAESLKYMTALRDRLSLRTFLCSTLHTQDDTLRSLFAWQSADAEGLCHTLQMFGFVSEEEIAKFLQPVLDALFTILVSHLGDRREEVDDLVFKGLVKVLSMTSDRRFPSFGSIIASYTAKHFAFSSSAPHLLRTMKAVMGRPASQEYRSLLKVWHNVFRFIIRSHELDRARTTQGSREQMEVDFKDQTRGILGEINDIMLSDNKVLIGSQTLAVQHYADILPDLVQVFTPEEIADMVIVFADTLSRAQGNLAVYKLLLILQIVKTLLDYDDTRARLIPAIVRWVRPHIGRYEEELFSARGETQSVKDSRQIKWLECNRLAVSVIAWTVNKLQELLDSPIIKSDPLALSQEEDNIEYCLTVVPGLFESYLELNSEATLGLLERSRQSPTVWKATPDVFPASHPFPLVSHLPPPSLFGHDEEIPPAGTFKCGLAEISVVISTLVIASPRTNIIRWLEEKLDIDGIDHVKDVLKLAFEVFNSVIRFDAFPQQWLTLSGLGFTAVMRFFEPLISFLSRSEFVPPIEEMDRFDVGLWASCIELLCDLLASNELALEDQGPQRRRASWIISGDLRDQGAVQLTKLWNAIGWQPISHKQTHRYGGYQTRFTGLAERILTLCLSSHEGLCESAVDILFSMIYAEYVLDGKFNSIQTEIFQTLERLFTQKATTASESVARAYFVSRLRSVFEATPDIDDNFRIRVGSFLDQVELFIDLLMAIRDLPETPQWKEERVAATVRLMEFFSKVGRDDLYVRFVHHLVSINVEARDWFGAGLALKLHADIYEWHVDGELVDEMEHSGIRLPAQTQFDRKEALLYHVLEYLAEAEAYEQAAEICQELVSQHRKKTFDVVRIGELLNHEAKLWERMGASSRPKPEYFRVAYFGNFTTLNLDKEFIVRGAPWCRYVDFCEQLHAKHPDAQIHRSKVPPSDAVRYGTQPVIWVTSVTPVPDLKRPMFRRSVPPAVQAYYRSNAVDKFETLRPYSVSADEKDPILQWLEKTTITTVNDLPALQARAEVVHIHHEHISPVDSAIVGTKKANRDLAKLAEANPIDVKMLGTALNGAVDSRVNGGVSVYKKHFLDPAYLDRHPGEAKNITALRDAIVHYVRTIQVGLVAHRRVNKDIAFHEALRTLYQKAYADEIAVLPPLGEGDSPVPAHSHLHPSPTLPSGSGPSGSKHASATPALAHLGRAPSPVESETSHVRNSYVLPPLRVGPRTPQPAATVTEPRPSFSNSISSSGHTRNSPSLDHGGHPGRGILLSPTLGSVTSLTRGLSMTKRQNGHGYGHGHARASITTSIGEDSVPSTSTSRAPTFGRSYSQASTSRVSESTERDDDFGPLPTSPAAVSTTAFGGSTDTVTVGAGAGAGAGASTGAGVGLGITSPTLPAPVSLSALGSGPPPAAPSAATGPTSAPSAGGPSAFRTGGGSRVSSAASTGTQGTAASRQNGIRRIGSLLRRQ
jgi:dedicator of cytokinesis protein 3